MAVEVGLERLSVWYGAHKVIEDMTVAIPARSVTAVIGPSGCGKSTVLRCVNRMHEVVPGARHEGRILLGGEDVHSNGTDPVSVRRRVGMVFQRPNPFPTKSVYDNVAAGLRLNGIRSKRDQLDEVVQASLERAGLWNEVRARLGKSSGSLSGGQQQRLCIARATAVEPEVLLMDEPCSALDPQSTLRIEDPMAELKKRYTIVIVTHNAAGSAGRRLDGVHDDRRGGRAGAARRIRKDGQDLHEPVRAANGGLRDRTVRMTRATYREGLAELEATVQEEGALVLRAIRGALNALRDGDAELADEVIAFDDEVDGRSRSVERQVEALLALQAPVAGDLRRIPAALHVNIHLEPMADLSVNIAKLAHAYSASPAIGDGFEDMGSRAEEMTRVALDSLRTRDLAAGETLVELDDLIDGDNRRVVGHLARLDGDADAREWALLMIVVSRCLERIGDNAVDIGEQTAYLVSGEFREFEDASKASDSRACPAPTRLPQQQ